MRALAHRRMMDQHDPEPSVTAGASSSGARRCNCSAAHAPDGHQRQARHRGRYPDQRHWPASAHEGKLALRHRCIAAHEVAPVAARVRDAATHVGVMIARHQRHVGGTAERVEPGACRHVFAGQCQIDKIAGDRDVVGGLPLEVGNDLRQHVGLVHRLRLRCQLTNPVARLPTNRSGAAWAGARCGSDRCCQDERGLVGDPDGTEALAGSPDRLRRSDWRQPGR